MKISFLELNIQPKGTPRRDCSHADEYEYGRTEAIDSEYFELW